MEEGEGVRVGSEGESGSEGEGVRVGSEDEGVRE